MILENSSMTLINMDGQDRYPALGRKILDSSHHVNARSHRLRFILRRISLAKDAFGSMRILCVNVPELSES
jgi:hypothetical protein